MQIVDLVKVRREALMEAETLLGDFIVDILVKTLEGVVKQWQHPLLWGIFVVE